MWRPRARPAIMACRPPVGPVRRAAAAARAVRAHPSVGVSSPPHLGSDRVRQADPGPAVRLLVSGASPTPPARRPRSGTAATNGSRWACSQSWPVSPAKPTTASSGCSWTTSPWTGASPRLPAVASVPGHRRSTGGNRAGRSQVSGRRPCDSSRIRLMPGRGHRAPRSGCVRACGRAPATSVRPRRRQ